MAKKGSRKKPTGKRRVDVDDYRHDDATRTNNPPVGLAHYDTEAPPVRGFEYDPHLDPSLQWAGKAEHSAFEVEAPSIHVHERISAEAIVTSAQRRTDADRAQLALFADERLDRTKAIEFYEHDLDWENRMILGDSLIVMASLLERERLGGQVQCVYVDPPYGVNFNSNFQARTSNRSPKANDAALTREPEQIQAYRDTWELGIHSYLTYLRDRLLLTHELLADTGSIFVQISVDNCHTVRTLLDEIFGPENFMSQVTFLKTSGSGSPNEATSLPETSDLLLWYARDRERVTYNQLYWPKSMQATVDQQYNKVELADGTRRSLTKAERSGDSPLQDGARRFRHDNLRSQSGSDKTRYPISFEGQEFRPDPGVWKTGEEGMQRLLAANRIASTGRTLNYVRYIDDFEWFPVTDIWSDTRISGFGEKKRYVVQTSPKVVQRCLAMTTAPGDLVLDPTCGSGTTAWVAEDMGRRWITSDTSRVALALARERLLTSKFAYYELLDKKRGVDGGIKLEAASRTTLRSIARGEGPEQITLHDRPVVDPARLRVAGPFSVEALSRYALNPADDELPPADTATDRTAASDHVTQLLAALKSQGIPRPDGHPLAIESIEQLASAGALQAEGLYRTDKDQVKRFAVSLGPRFGTITPTQVDEALADAYGYELVVFAGFAAHAETQALLEGGKRGRYEVALLLANPDLLLGSLLKNTTASQTFRLYASPDVQLDTAAGGFLVTVNGVDAFDASTGEVKSSSQSNVRAWFLDTDYDGMVFRIDQAFFLTPAPGSRLPRHSRGRSTMVRSTTCQALRRSPSNPATRSGAPSGS